MKKRNQANTLARECITTALIKLAVEKPFSAISISELTQKAGVSRMTYYRNYSSKEEVFQSYMHEILTSYKKDIYKMGIPETFGNYEHILHCFRYFEKYQDFFNCLMKIDMGKILLDSLTSYLLDTYYTEASGVTMYYTMQAYAGALFNVYMAWMGNGAKESVEELAAIIQNASTDDHTAL